MAHYLIKKTYLDGPHAGKSYYLTKGGYVVDLDKTHFESDTYKTLGHAKRRCDQLYMDNFANIRWERFDEQLNIKKGLRPKKHFIYYEESYEPVEVDAISDHI